MTYPPPGYAYPAPPPAPKKSKTLRTVLIIVGVVVVLCLSGIGVGAYFVYRSVSELKSAGDAVNGYFDDLEAGNTDSAYGRLCEESQDRYTRDEFADLVDDGPRLTGHEFTNMDVDTTNGVTTGSVTVTLHYANGSTESVVIELTREDGSWQVCANPS